MSTAVTGLSDFHKMIISCLKNNFKKNFTKKDYFQRLLKV